MCLRTSFEINHYSHKIFQLLKFSITFYLVNLMTYSSEVYPTIVRSQGYGICMSVGQLSNYRDEGLVAIGSESE